MKKIAIMLILLCVTTFAQQKGSFTDPRNGKNSSNASSYYSTQIEGTK